MRRYLQLHPDHLVFALLLAIAVAGRLGRVDWNFTPVVAVALFAGFYFRSRLTAALLPLAALAISDFAEPWHNSRWVQLTVWAAMVLPAVLGPWLREAQGKWQLASRGAVASLLPSAFFFLTTNFAVWATGAGLSYSADLAGLATCYAAGLPFYGKMLAGDLFYLSLLFGAWAAVTSVTPATAKQCESRIGQS